MLTSLAKRLAARLPHHQQQALKRRHFRREIGRDEFRTNEPEWDLASQWLSAGDWAIDIGANIGHYTKRFSDLVGPAGRVLAFEPVPATFELLAANAAQFRHANVTLLNLAASDSTRSVSMSMPRFESGLDNYYQAAITDSGDAALSVLSCAVDALAIPSGRVKLIKIDAEGHDAVALRGAGRLLERDKPVLVIESAAPEVASMLVALGYAAERLAGSSNTIYRAADR